MISKGEVGGLAAAVVGHGVLFALLALGYLNSPSRPAPIPDTMEVSLVDKVGLIQAAPVVSEAAQAARKVEVEAEPEPEPAPAEPEPKPVTKPEPPKPAPAKDAVKPPEKSKAGSPGSGTGTGRGGGRTGGLTINLGADGPSKGESPNPPAKMTGEAAANIASVIQRQVQPCADRQVSPGPGAERIRAVVRLRLNRNGGLSAPPEIVDHTGVDDTNQIYVRRVDDAVKAIFAGCSPLRDLPDELYDVTNGWKVFTLRYRLTG